jgi:hypothetical protein
MSTIRSLIKSAASTVGPDARGMPAKADAIQIPTANEDMIVISKMDKVLFDAFGRNSPVIPAGIAYSTFYYFED